MSETKFVGLLLAMAFAAFAFGAAALSCQREVPRALTHVEAALAPAGPPCIHEVCGERPARLKCDQFSTGRCDGYAVLYERHCVCDRWATLAEEQDGGAK